MLVAMTKSVQSAVNAAAARAAGLEKMPSGVPAAAYFAMGMQEAEGKYGWYNGTNVGLIRRKPSGLRSNPWKNPSENSGIPSGISFVFMQENSFLSGGIRPAFPCGSWRRQGAIRESFLRLFRR